MSSDPSSPERAREDGLDRVHPINEIYFVVDAQCFQCHRRSDRIEEAWALTQHRGSGRPPT